VIEYLTLEDVLELIEDLGVGPIRDIGLLDSAVHRPQATVFGTDAYPDLDQKAAVLLESLVRNHALIDGNKRIGWLSTVVFYGLNNIELEAPDDDAYELVIAIANGGTTYQASNPGPNSGPKTCGTSGLRPTVEPSPPSGQTTTHLLHHAAADNRVVRADGASRRRQLHQPRRDDTWLWPQDEPE